MLITPRCKNLSIRKQCNLLCVNRSKLYYRPVPEKPENVKMMNILDKHLTVHPTEGVVSMVLYLQELGHAIGPKRVRRMFRLMGRQTHPEIINSDQGTQYTSALWTQYLEKLGIRISMDGKGRALDNIWIERFRKSIKYDYVYLNPAEDGFELYEGVQNHIAYYNDKIHHTTRQSPNKRYLEALKIAA